MSLKLQILAFDLATIVLCLVSIAMANRLHSLVFVTWNPGSPIDVIGVLACILVMPTFAAMTALRSHELSDRLPG